MQKRLISKAFIIITCFSLLLIGCKDVEETTPEATSSEVVSEVESEVISEEVSESASVDLSEVVAEETSVKIMDLTPYTVENGKKVIDLFNDMEYDEFKVVVWINGIGAKTILSNGDSYQLQNEDEFMYLYYPNQMQNVQCNTGYNEHVDYYDVGCSFDLYGMGNDMEITFSGTDVDGKEYEITIYVTKDWEYAWE